ncbi:hypothetical protein PG996_011483 [Apiospora saccharicola]|uniref:Wings apart-like protein C-terminal domain-containing protein n=1 Tax=Apiospora saccharicola TaxID=335842 RepID=A0ABR1UHG8_9PEZI
MDVVHKTPQPSRYRISKATAKPDRQQPWTASRCHRLLRPLLSRLALLRKELSSLPEPAALAVGTDLPTTKERRKFGKRQSSDCQWMLPRKKMRHTYAQQQKFAERQTSSVSGSNSGSFSETAQQPLTIKLRAAKDLQAAHDDIPAPGEAVAFTPLVRRARGHEVPSPANMPQFRNYQGSSSSQTRRKRSGTSRRGELEERLATVRSSGSASRHSDYEAIFRSLEALLKGTAWEEEKTKGASSLLDMCLKRMPWYIAGVQAWELDEAEQNGTKSAFNSPDTSLRLYNELETLGASQQGWSHLRTVARADGIAAVREAMLEGLLNDDFCMLVIDLCTEYEATAEAEALMEVFIQRQYPSPSGPEAAFAENDALRPLSFLWDFSIAFTQHSFLLRQYTMLLANGSLPVGWLVTGGFERVWGLAHRVLSRGSKALAAIDFLVTAIISLCRHHRVSQKLDGQASSSEKELEAQILPSISRSLAILSAMNIVGEMETHGNELFQPVGSRQQNIAFISQNITYTFFGCLVEVEGRKRRSSNMAKDLLYLAAFLASSSSLRTERAHSRLTSAFELALGTSPITSSKADMSTHDSVKHYSSMISLISQIARICGRGSSEAPFQHMERLCHDLQLLGLEQNMMDSITRAGALFLAQQTSNLRDLVYAESLVSAHHQQVEDEMSPANEGYKHRQRAATTTDILLGYRWEETIGEWVVVSPVAQRRKQQAQHRRSGRFQQPDSTARKVTGRDVSPLPAPPAASAASARLAGPTGRPASDAPTEPVADSFANPAEENACDGRQSASESDKITDDDDSGNRHRHQTTTLQPRQQCNLLKPTSNNRRCSMRPTTKTTAPVAGPGYDDAFGAVEGKENVNAQAAAAVHSKVKAARHSYGPSSSSVRSSSTTTTKRALGQRRRVRLSGDLIIHSDDELGI